MSKVREITFYSTKGYSKKPIKTSATTWREIREKGVAEGVDLENMRCVESINKTSLDSGDAILPEGDLTIFMYPIKTKSGAKDKPYSEMSWKELRQIVKDNKKEEGFLVHMNSLGKNYTQLKTEELVERLDSWFNKSGGEEAVLEATPKKKDKKKNKNKKSKKDSGKSEEALRREAEEIRISLY